MRPPLPPPLPLLGALLLLALTPPLAAQPSPSPPLEGAVYRPGVDVERYAFALELSDTSDDVEGYAVLDVRFTADTLTVLPLDLLAAAEGGGMTVSAVTEEGAPVAFRHRGGRLEITLASTPSAGTPRTYTVAYRGTPADGLIIGQNRHGQRTFFGDNWPNRARHWLPTVDHPSDKALVEWTVTAPAAYNVVANGRRTEDATLEDGRRRVRYVTADPIPTKVAVFGAAPFAMELVDDVAGVPVETWVYPQDREAGYRDFARAARALQLFTALIGEYPYEKLANVQSTTRYGGMENAGAIFYDERSVTGTGANEATIAHEVAHQWFGNAVTERDWPHLWLSEGFATYLTHVYYEMTYGRDAMAQRMARDRAQVAAFAQSNPTRPLVDASYADPTQLLNANSYQKGGWVLHLLRQAVGDEAFFGGLRTFYARYRDGNADTDDFRRVMEEVSAQNLRALFDQWMLRPGIPRLTGSWRYADGALSLSLRQTQPGEPFSFPLEVGIVTQEGVLVETVEVTGGEQILSIPLPAAPEGVVLDPRVNALAVVEAFAAE